MTLKAVMFDLDGTLMDLKYASELALRDVWEKFPYLRIQDFHEVELRHKDLLEFFHRQTQEGNMSMDESRMRRFKALLSFYKGSDATDEEAIEASAIYRKKYVESERAIPGTIELLHRLRSLGIKIAVITNNAVEEQMRKICKCGFEGLIDVLVISEEVGISKPHPEIFQITLERLGCEAHETIMIGDSIEYDVEGAMGLDIRAIWVNNFKHKNPDPERIVEIESFEPLEDILAILLLGNLNNEISFR